MAVEGVREAHRVRGCGSEIGCEGFESTRDCG